MIGRYTLKCRDEELLTFRLSRDAFGTPEVEVLTCDEANAHLMPWGLAADERSLFRWLSSRALPHNRRYAEQLCRSMGFSIDDTLSIYSISYGLSLNDSYWTPEEADGRSFGEINLYRNGFSDVLAAVAYTGHISPERNAHGLTPELTTDGMLHKAWRIDSEGRRILYKGSSNDWDPGEPASEVLASRLAQRAGLHSVLYKMGEWQGEFCSTCECFCSEDVSYTPFATATGIVDLGSALAFCARLGEDVFEEFRDMLIFDCLTLNTDRHFSNFGLLRETEAGRCLGLAPIFDNGRSLLPMVPTEMLTEAKYQVATMAPAFGGRTFDELAGRVMGPRQIAWLSELAEAASPLVDGSGSEHSLITARWEGLEKIVRSRAAELSKVKPISLDEMTPALERAWAAKASQREGVNLCPAKPIERKTNCHVDGSDHAAQI